jgi:dipeptidase E
VPVLLTSSGLQAGAVQDAFIRILPQQPLALRAVIVTTACVQWKERNKHATRTRDYLSALGFACCDFLDVETEPAEHLHGYDVIYLNGGNPFYLLHHLRRSGADSILRQISSEASVLVGASAGAVVLGPSIAVVRWFDSGMDAHGVTDYQGLGMVDFIVMPHLNRWDADPAFAAELRRFQRATPYPVIGIADNEALLVRRGSITRIAKPSAV